MSLTCSKCLTRIPLDPIDGHVPAWCPKCGTDNKAFTLQATSVMGVLREACESRPAHVVRTETSTALTALDSRSRAPAQTPPLPPQLADIPLEDLELMAGPPRRAPQMGIVVLVAGIACLVGFFYLASASFTKLATYRQVEGRVVDLVTTRMSTRGASVHPVVSFQVDGARHQFQSAYAMGWFWYKLGDTAQVLYPPGRPGEASRNDFDGLWALPLLCGIPGFGLFAVWSCVRLGVGAPRTSHRLA